MQWIKAFHVIAMVAWFAALFYLPRLYVYHCQAAPNDKASQQRFQTMERRLYYAIMWPAGILTTVFGFILLNAKLDFYTTQNWMHAKLIAVAVLWIFHLFCGKWRRDFAKSNNKHSEKFYRVLNEAPTVLLIFIIIMTIVKPHFL